jgi:hypothetical protein
MSFDPDMAVELQLAGVWTDITGEVRIADGVNIGRGRPAEGTDVDRSTCDLTLNNRDGQFSPRNPTSPYYGLIGRNTPIRVRQGTGGYLLFNQPDSQAFVPDNANISVTGDIDIRVDVKLNQWEGTSQELAGKYEITGDQRSWAFYKNEDATLSFRWFTLGTLASVDQADSTVPIPNLTGRQTLRVTVDVNNGAAGSTTTFYYGPSVDGPWTQIGATVTQSPATSIFDSTAELDVGSLTDFGSGVISGKVYRFQLYAGLTGSDLRADLNLADADPESTTFTDSEGNEWEYVEAFAINTATRFVGELSAWPPKWNLSGTDVWTPVEASGILRRLTQGADTLRSAIYRAITGGTTQPLAYWPCEDSSGSTFAASATPGVDPMRILAGTASFAGYDGFAGTDPILVLGDANFEGVVPPYVATGEAQIRFLMHTPPENAGNVIINVFTTGTAARWRMEYRTGGDLSMEIRDSEGTLLHDSGTINFDLDNDNCRISLEMTQNGANIDWGIVTLIAGAETGNVHSATLNSHTFGRVSKVRFNGNRVLDLMAIGHVTVYDSISTIFDVFDELTGFDGESADRRIERLCTEEGIRLRRVGILNDSAAMGPQRSATLIDLLHEAEAADGGILYETRDVFGLGYRTRKSMYSQAPAATLDYEGSQLSTIEPTEDDQLTRNDITVTRTGGSSARVTLDTGPLSVQAPPDGVGRYDEAVELNLFDDTTLQDQAGWRVGLGTVDEPRFPQIGVNLAHPTFVGDDRLSDDVRELDVGDRLVVENPPAWLPPGDISQLAQGFTERISTLGHDITVNCSPESPWRVGILDDDVLGRLDTDGSTTVGALTSTQTTITVLTTDPASPMWTVEDTHFPFDIRVGGEVMTVTDILPTSSFVNSSAAVSSSGGAAATLSPTLPASTQAGDTVYVFATIRNSGTGTPQTPASWNLAEAFGGGNCRLFSRVYDGAWSMPTLTFVGGAANEDIIAQAATFRGIDSTAFTAARQLNGSAQNIAYPALTGIRAGMLVLWLGWKQDDWTSVATLGGVGGEIGEPVSTAGSDAGMVWDYQIKTLPINVSAASFTVTGGASAISRGAVVAFRGAQTFTVTRSVNGVVKAHAEGAAVSLAQPLILAL